MNSNIVGVLMSLLSGGNPEQVARSIMDKNPQAKAIINQMQESGMNGEQFAHQIAKQNNIALDPIINIIRQKGIKI